jgi:hypothetical protein
VGNGTLNNSPTFTTAFGGGWSMDGTDDYLLTDVDSNALTPNNNWTVSIWCSLNSYPTYSGNNSKWGTFWLCLLWWFRYICFNYSR